MFLAFKALTSVNVISVCPNPAPSSTLRDVSDMWAACPQLHLPLSRSHTCTAFNGQEQETLRTQLMGWGGHLTQLDQSGSSLLEDQVWKEWLPLVSAGLQLGYQRSQNWTGREELERRSEAASRPVHRGEEPRDRDG